jgi:beta-glucosidase
VLTTGEREFWAGRIAGVLTLDPLLSGRVNGTHACHNSIIQNGQLKGELNFQGSIMSDWGGTWDSRASIEGGLDWEMPGYNFGGALGTFFGNKTVALVQNGTISEDRIDDQVTRILTPFYALGQDEVPLPSPNVIPWFRPAVNLTSAGNYRLVTKRETLKLVKQIAEDGTVLLKNKNNALPLKAPRKISVIGSAAGPGPRGDRGCGATGLSCENAQIGGGSGWATSLNYIDPLMSIKMRALQDLSSVDHVLNDTDLDGARYSAVQTDVALVFLKAWATEEADRQLDITYTYPSALADGGVYDGEALIKAVASVNPNTIVVAGMPSATILESWIDHPNITAVLTPLEPGEQYGPAIASVLYGDVSPSGKLPFTIARRVEDYPPNPIVNSSDINPQSTFTEGVNFDYRWFDVKGITPRYGGCARGADLWP